jgi:hypothetical protein
LSPAVLDALAEAINAGAHVDWFDDQPGLGSGEHHGSCRNTFLATFLSQGQSFFDNFQSVLGALRTDAPASVTALDRLCGFSTPLTQWLQQREVDFTSLEISGSPVFYE